MGTYAIDTIEPAFKKMKGLIFPLNLRRLIVLATIVILSKSPLRNNGSTLINILNNNEVYGFSPQSIADSQTITANYLGPIAILITLPLIIILLLLSYISNVFSFIFIETAITCKPQIKTKFSKNKDLGLSTFLFDIIISIMFVVGTFLIASPLIIIYLKTGTIATTFTPLMMLYAATAILAFIVLLFGLSIVSKLNYDFIMPKMFNKNIGVKDCWKCMLPKFKKEWLQTIGYLIIKFILASIAGFAILLLLIPALLIIAVIVMLFVGIGYMIGLFSAISTTTSIIIAAPFTIALLIISTYIITIFTLPVPVFFRYYSMEVLKKLDKTYKY